MAENEKNTSQKQTASSVQDEVKAEARDVTPKKKSKSFRIVLTIVEIVCIIGVVVSGYFVAKTLYDEYKEEELSRKNEDEFNDDTRYDDIVNPDRSKNPSDHNNPSSSGEETGSGGTESSGKDTESSEEEDEPFVLRYLTGKSIKKANEKSVPKQIVAWMEMTGYTNAVLPAKIKSISQPVAQGTDNAYYLNHDAYGEEKDYGAVYVDCRCDMDDLLNNKNIVVYAHAKSTSRFGILKALNKSQEWMDAEKYHYIYLQTETETTIWQIFSWYTTDKDAAYRNTKFTDNDAFVEYCNSLQSKNKIKTLPKYKFTKDDVIMTLSTCKGIQSDTRVAVHAVLIAHAYLEDLKK